MSLERPHAVVFAGMTRQGPGSRASTLKALSLLPPLPETGTVLDLGCGTGASTLVLAEQLDRPIHASDVNPDSLDQLAERLAAAGLAGRVETRVASLGATGEPPDSAALIWSEGAVFTVGVEAALRHWHPILKSGGAVAFTELVWFGRDRPSEADAFFGRVYPPMTDAATLLARCLGCGYRLQALFALPEADWWDEYYAELAPALERHRDHADVRVRNVVAVCDEELAVARRCGGSYGYAFVVLTKA